MTNRLPIHMLDATGATDGQIPKYDQATGRVIWADGSVGIAIEDEGASVLLAASRLNFTGAGVAVTDAGGGEVDVNIPGGGGGGGGGGFVLLAQGQTVPQWETANSASALGLLVARKAATRRQAIINDAPVAFLTLDETLGAPTDKWVDAGGAGRHFTPGAGVVPGKAPLVPDGGFAASGSGTATIGTYAGAHGIGTSAWSLEFVLKLPAGTATYKGGIIKFGTNGNGASIGVGGSNDTNLGRNFAFGRNGINYYLPGLALPEDGSAHHFCVTSDASQVWRTYMDGQMQVTSGAGVTINAPGAELRVGDAETNFIPAAFTLDNVAFFNKTLSATQVQAHVGATQGGGLLGWWDGTKIQPLATA